MPALRITLVSLLNAGFLFSQFSLFQVLASEINSTSQFRMGKIGVSFLNLRHGPGLQYKVLEILKGGSQVTYLPERRHGWVHVTTGKGTNGWVKRDFLKPLDTENNFAAQAKFSLPFPNESEVSHKGLKIYAVVNAELLNVREGPGNHFEVINMLHKGTHVGLENIKKKGWQKIRFHLGSTGWVSQEYIKIYQPGKETHLIRKQPLLKFTSLLEASIKNYMEDLYLSGRLQRQDQLSIVVQDLSTGQQLVSIRQDRPVKSASLIKVPILHAYMIQRYQDEIIHTVENQEHLMNMIRYSSNESTNWMLRLLGGPTQVHDLLDRTEIYQKMKLVEYIPNDGKTYRNKISVADMNKLLVRLWFNRVLGKKFSNLENRLASDQMLYLMSLPGYKWVLDRIKDATCFSSRKVVRIWDKTGFVKGLNGSAGIVEIDTPHGRRAYTLVHTMERTNFRSIRGNANKWSIKVAMVMRRISEMAFAFISSRYESYNQCGLGLLIQYAFRASGRESGSVPL